MDMLAHELKMDPAELPPQELHPSRASFRSRPKMGAVYDSGDYGKALDPRA